VLHVLVPTYNATDGEKAMELAKSTVVGGNLNNYDTFAAYYRGKDIVVDCGMTPESVYVVDVVAEKVM
jgi:nitrous oxide reductase